MTKGKQPPKSAEELLARYAEGERDFTGADLAGAKLSGAGLTGVSFTDAVLTDSIVGRVNLSRADLTGADLTGADLSGAELNSADLTGAGLTDTRLYTAKLVNVDLTDAKLFHTHLARADLRGTNFRGATLISTPIVSLDLREVVGLDKIRHLGPSPLGMDALAQSKGRLPEVFLRGCGLSEWEVQAARLYDPELSASDRQDILYSVFDLQTSQAVQVNPLFLSYSRSDRDDEYASNDSGFLDALGAKLDEKDVRYWRDVHHATAGKLDKVIDRAMRLNPTVVIVLSERSLASDWVEDEVNRARELERDLGRDVLCPVTLGITPGAALDFARERWSSTIHTQLSKYNILDFSDWKDSAAFDRQFRRLLDGLKLFYEPPGDEGDE